MGKGLGKVSCDRGGGGACWWGRLGMAPQHNTTDGQLDQATSLCCYHNTTDRPQHCRNTALTVSTCLPRGRRASTVGRQG